MTRNPPAAAANSPQVTVLPAAAAPLSRRRRYRRIAQAGFFALFVLAPPLDLLRLDLTLGHFILFGQPWTLGIDGLADGTLGAAQAAGNLLLRAFLPVLLGAVGFIWIARRYGRLYCGWLCPHFSVVELINGLMRRASGRPSVWERQPLPERRADGRRVPADARWWLPTGIAIALFSFLWALTLLTYLLPPKTVYTNLLALDLTRNQAVFLGAATAVLFIEFTFARHLFCRFGCAVGLFQSLAWMSKKDAMVVGFDTARAAACRSCDNACDNACPMRLKPRSYRRAKFTCTQCGECISACEVVQGEGRPSLLDWSIRVEEAASRGAILPEWKSR